MEEFFNGLVERTLYYEQFESFRNTHISRPFQDMPVTEPELKYPA